MMASRAALAISILSTVTFAMAAAQEREVSDRRAMIDDRAVPAVQGVWRSRGYGYVVKIGPDGPKLFHVAGGFCYADPRSDNDPDSIFVYYRPLERGTVAFSSEPGQTRFVFDRLPDLPAACTDTRAWSRPRIAALVAATFTDLYPSFAARGIDWPARTTAVEPSFDKIADDARLFTTLRSLLSGIDDPHVELQAEVRGEESSFMPGDGITLRRVRASAGRGGDAATLEDTWQRAYRRGILDTILQGKGQQAANDRLIWGRVGDIGYINLLSMSGFSTRGQSEDTRELDAALDEAMVAFKGAQAVIVDVSNNSGGYDHIGRHIAGRFADRRALAYTKVAAGTRDVEPQPFYVGPSKRPRFLGPVYLLTSDLTVSAGETFTLFMRALPNVVHVGTNTRGAFSDMIDKPLPNGWQLAMSAEIYRNAAGENYEARGIPPQHRREVFPADDLFGGHARTVTALMDEIRRSEAGGN